MQIIHKFTLSFREFQNVKSLPFGALLTAMYVLSAVFLNFYPSDSIKISISFVFIAVAAYLYGPVMAMVVGGMGDFLAWVIHPHGALIVGITLCCALQGLIFGLFYYRAKFTLVRCIIACAVETALIELPLKSLVLGQTYGTPLQAQFLVRLPAATIMLGIMIALTFVFFKALLPAFNRIKK